MEKMIAVGMVWGATNAIMRRGALLWDEALKSSAKPHPHSPMSQKVRISLGNWFKLLSIWQYSIPFLINLSASATFFAILSDAFSPSLSLSPMPPPSPPPPSSASFSANAHTSSAPSLVPLSSSSVSASASTPSPSSSAIFVKSFFKLFNLCYSVLLLRLTRLQSHYTLRVYFANSCVA